MRRVAISILTALALVTGTTVSRANGRIPEANHLVVDETDPTFLALRMSFGLLLSRDRGVTWDWVCESAFGNKGTYDPPIAIAAGKTLLIGTFSGLIVSEDTGCTWKAKPPILDRYVLDVATLPGKPNEAVAVTNTGNGSGYESLVVRSSDGAKTWATVGPPLDPSLSMDTIDFAKSDPQRFYITARSFVPKLESFLLVSTDGGQSFVSRPIPLEPNDLGAYIAAVDPNDAERLYVRTVARSDGGADITAGRVIESIDGGKNWIERWRGGPPLGFALSPDGKKIWIGSGYGGLYAADTTTFAFALIQPFIVRCLAATSERLYACGDEYVEPDAAPREGFSLGESLDDGKTFRSIYKLSQIRGPLSCPSGTETAKCVAEWPQLKATLGIDGGTIVKPPVVVPPPDGCDCASAVGTNAGAGSAVGLAIAVALVLARRRRR